jgi:ubiquinone/menaquinone biosynthesis C-methylase UbiE
MEDNTNIPHSDKAAQRGEPSYVWRAGQQRRLDMLHHWSGEQLRGAVLENGCGVGQYLERLSEEASLAVGMDIEFARLLEAKQKNPNLVCGAGEYLPFERSQFDAILSNEVIEHVVDDHEAVAEMARVLRVGGRMFVFCPNRGYPFETHGVYWKGKYHFGNKLFVNYLPDFWRNKLAPHVRVYTRRKLRALFECQPLRAVYHTVIFGGYDNIIQRSPALGKFLRGFLQFLEKTPLRALGLSQFWVLEKG